MDTSKALKILIVDNNEMTRTLLKVILRGDRFSIVGEASDGQSALSKAKILQPDLILLDVNMPNGSGLEILKPIKTLLPETIVLMVTGNDDPDMVATAMQDGASGFIVKPFNTQSLLGTLEKIKEKFVVARPATNAEF